MLKKFSIWLTKNLIVLLLTTFIFFAVTIDFPSWIRYTINDIFEHASPSAQAQAISKLAETCSSLRSADLEELGKICSDKSLSSSGISAREDCKNYGLLAKVGALCKDYSDRKINQQEFFFGVVSDAIPFQQTESGDTDIDAGIFGIFEKYNRAGAYIYGNKLIYFMILAILSALLYFLIADIKTFIIALTHILLRIGILIILPYFAILIYGKFVGIDTSSILGSMLGSGNIIELKAVLSVILIMASRTYNSFIITLGALFLAVGFAGKLYMWRINRNSKNINQNVNKSG